MNLSPRKLGAAYALLVDTLAVGPLNILGPLRYVNYCRRPFRSDLQGALTWAGLGGYHHPVVDARAWGAARILDHTCAQSN